MPAKGIFVLGVGHVRRKTVEPGERADAPAQMTKVEAVELDEREWRVLLALKRELTAEEIHEAPWIARAREAGVSFEEFCDVARSLQARKLIGRFSTFLEHVKPSETGVRVTRFNALFHWAVPAGREIEAGGEVGRHLILTHCYWREGGPEFGNVNIMAVAHGTEKDRLLAHKAAIDDHLRACGIPVSYTNVFWGGRSEIKPSEISPFVYREWQEKMAARRAPSDGGIALYFASPLISRYVRERVCASAGSKPSMRICLRYHLPSIFWPLMTSNRLMSLPCQSKASACRSAPLSLSTHSSHARIFRAVVGALSRSFHASRVLMLSSPLDRRARPVDEPQRQVLVGQVRAEDFLVEVGRGQLAGAPGRIPPVAEPSSL